MSSRQTSNWISLSDMMTGLMLVFMLIAVLTISQVVAKENERQELLTKFDVSKEEIYNDLENAFGKKKNDWGVEVTRDLVVKFNNPDLLFDIDGSALKPEYITILDEFIPTYLNIVNNPKYADKIKEIRIEGHTADYTDIHPNYMSTVSLSQDRANSVLAHLRDSFTFQSLQKKDQDQLTFWFSANGLGNGRTLDRDGQFSYETSGVVSPLSRRVEFRIVTNSDELIDEIISKQKLEN